MNEGNAAMADRICTTCGSLIPSGTCELCSRAYYAMTKLVSMPRSVRQWECETCIVKNPAGRPDCDKCGSPPPQSFEATEDEVNLWTQAEERKMRTLKWRLKNEQERNIKELEALDRLSVIQPKEAFTCIICYCGIQPEDGVLLKNCGHIFCRDCLCQRITVSEEADIVCPYAEMEGAEYKYKCEQRLRDTEIRAIAPEDVVKRLEHMSLRQAKHKMRDSFLCRTNDCDGFCVYEDGASVFVCSICKHENCIFCKAIHEGETCHQYRNNKKAFEEQQETKMHLLRMLEDGSAMRCCNCAAIVTKDEDTCYWVQCLMCKTELCWATKGPRWGPAGEGDISGGCRCGVNGVKCAPQCTTCH